MHVNSRNKPFDAISGPHTLTLGMDFHSLNRDSSKCGNQALLGGLLDKLTDAKDVTQVNKRPQAFLVLPSSVLAADLHPDV